LAVELKAGHGACGALARYDRRNARISELVKYSGAPERAFQTVLI
jgi:hypothetical protein